MENLRIIPRENNLPLMQLNREPDQSSGSHAFIEANTSVMSFVEIRQDHIIPVFVKDNEPLISQSDFILATLEAVAEQFRGEQILQPQIRVSHPIKGRIPDARNKPASELQDWEKTIYYERMMFCIEIPTIMDTIDGNQLSLMVGGVKAYNLDNISTKKGSAEHFKLFIGFKNLVCTNLCVRTDGYLADLKVIDLDQLGLGIRKLLENYDQHRHLQQMQSLSEYSLTEQQFAQLLGRCRMYNYLPAEEKKQIPGLLFGDSQLNAVCQDYYRDESFCRQENGDISLWRLYNLFTGANKTTYIDQFLDRSVNALDFSTQVQLALDGSSSSWFLS